MQKSAFTLIELTIVIVIISFIISVIMISSTMINNSQIQSVIKEIATIKSAVENFKQQYDNLPGDYPYATTMGWNNSSCSSNNSCNGNGDGIISPTTTGQANRNYSLTLNEDMLAWLHLSKAKLLPGNFNGALITSGSPATGINIPAGKLPSAGYNLQYSNLDSIYSYYNSLNGNSIRLINNYQMNYSVISPYDAYSIDKKIDDGVASSGKILSTPGSETSPSIPNCITAGK